MVLLKWRIDLIPIWGVSVKPIKGISCLNADHLKKKSSFQITVNKKTDVDSLVHFQSYFLIKPCRDKEIYFLQIRLKAFLWKRPILSTENSNI